MLLAFGAFILPVQAANKGPDKSSNSYAYIKIYQKSNTNAKGTWLYVSKNISEKTSKISGATYNKKTNTLTLKNFKKAGYIVEANMMGTDFKIKVTGTNTVQSIRVFGDNYGGSLALTGKGKLTANKNKKAMYGIVVYAEASSSALSFAKGTKVTAYRGSEELVDYEGNVKKTTGDPVKVIGTKISKASKALYSKGKLSGKVKKSTSGAGSKYYDFRINAAKVTNK